MVDVSNTDADLSGNTLTTEENAYTVTGLWTFTTSPTFSANLAFKSGTANTLTLDHGISTARTWSFPDATSTFVGTDVAQTLTSKTLTSPVLTTPQINDTSADHQYVFAVSELTADRTVTMPLLTGNDTFIFAAFAATLTNKTIDLASNTATGTAAEFNTAVSDDTLALVSDNLSVFAATTSAQLAGVISNETGSGALVFGTAPSIAGATLTGVLDAGAATSFEIPNGAAPTVNAAGEIAVDTTVASYDGLIKYYDGTTEMVVVAMPTTDLTTTDNDHVAYSTANSGFNMEAAVAVSHPRHILASASALTLDSSVPPAASTENHTEILSFDADTDEAAYLRFQMPDSYGTETISFDVIYKMASATSGDVIWACEVWAATAGESGDTESYDTANTVTDTVPGTAGLTALATITLTNKDSVAASDLVTLRISRDANAGGDTATGDAELVTVTVRWTE